MKTSLFGKCMLASALFCMAAGAVAQNTESPLVVGIESGHGVHIFPTPSMAGTLPPATPLIYHGGPVMSYQQSYAIFWLPAKLQNGNTTMMSAKYQPVIKNFLADYPSHGIQNNSTQYYSTTNGVNSYIHNSGAFVAYYVDTNPYPASGCSDTATPGNCLTDAQIQAEIQRVMTLKGWTAGPSKMYLMFTSSGEGSCFDNTSTSCAYTAYCAYHGYFGTNSNPVIYGNEPYGDPNYCYAGNQQSPNGDKAADAAVNVASHEMTEANTDPELNAWYSASGYEIGDLCAWSFGTLTWDSALANQMWNGHFYDLQLEYNNHTSGCVNVGP